MIVYDLAGKPAPDRLIRGGCLVEQVRRVAFLGRPGEVPPELLAGEARTGLDGVRYWLTDDGLALADLRRVVGLPTVLVDLGDHGQVPIVPAGADGFVMGLDGTVTEVPATAYGRLAREVADRLDQGQVAIIDPQVLDLARAALATTHRGTAELFHELGVLTTRTVEALVLGAISAPKADPASDG